jgi:hypothetical protein
MNDVPTDISHIRIVTYDTRKRDWRDQLRTDITAALRAVLTEPTRYLPSDPALKKRSGGSQTRLKATGRRVAAGATLGAHFATRTDAMARAAAEDLAKERTQPHRKGTQGYISVTAPSRSAVKQLAALMNDHYGVFVNWKPEGGRYAIWWDHTNAPEVSKVSRFAEMLKMFTRKGCSLRLAHISSELTSE